MEFETTRHLNDNFWIRISNFDVLHASVVWEFAYTYNTVLKHTKRTKDILNIMIGTVTEFIHLFPKLFFFSSNGQAYFPQRNSKTNFLRDTLSTNSLTLISYNSVLLQTARAKGSSIDERYSHNLSLFSDGGSQLRLTQKQEKHYNNKLFLNIKLT